LQPAGQLSSAEPTGEAGAYDEYISDPAKPVPIIDWTEVGLTANYMLTDQRFASRCSDVLVYQTEILERDLRLAGPIEVNLRLSTTGTDSDWIVKIIDVYPDDYLDPTENSTKIRMGVVQRLIRGDVIRGKFHDSL
jgi:predicted acyl esterase